MQGNTAMVDWAARQDIFGDDASALEFLRVALEDVAYGTDEDRVEFAKGFRDHGALHDAMRLLEGQPRKVIEEVIEHFDTGWLVRWLREHEDRVESDGFAHSDTLAVLAVLTRSQDLEVLDACLAAIARNLTLLR